MSKIRMWWMWNQRRLFDMIDSTHNSTCLRRSKLCKRADFNSRIVDVDFLHGSTVVSRRRHRSWITDAAKPLLDPSSAHLESLSKHPLTIVNHKSRITHHESSLAPDTHG